MAACWAQSSSSSSWPWEGGLADAGINLQAPLVSNYKQLEQQQQQQQPNSGCDPMVLRLGKRTYFEDSAGALPPPPHPRIAAADDSSPVPVSRMASSVRKKQRGPSQPPATPSCQVEGCSADLSGSKGYHRRHRVCEVHSKTPKNMVAGIEQRFCQQCSRFHVLGEFDEGKRSCRRRLAGHNERRRKPPPSEAFALHCHPSLFQAGPSRSLLAHHQQQSQHQHLLDGTFIVSPNGKSSWPDSSVLHRGAMHQLHHQGSVQLQQQAHPGSSFFLKSINRESVASQGVYQFLKCASSTSPSSSSIASVLPIEPGIVSSAGALSLLSAEPWSSSSPSPTSKMFSNSSNAPLFHLHLQHDGYHQNQQQREAQIPHHHQPQQQQQQPKFGLNEFLQYQKPNLVFDV